MIGKKTAEVLIERGYKVDFIPYDFVAEAFVEEFLPFVTRRIQGCFFQKEILAREYIAEELMKQGAIVDEVIVYETYFQKKVKDYVNRCLQAMKSI